MFDRGRIIWVYNACLSIVYHPFFLDRISVPAFSPSHFKVSRFECLVARQHIFYISQFANVIERRPAFHRQNNVGTLGSTRVEQVYTPGAIYTFLWLDKLLFHCTQNDGFSRCCSCRHRPRLTEGWHPLSAVDPPNSPLNPSRVRCTCMCTWTWREWACYTWSLDILIIWYGQDDYVVLLCCGDDL